MRPRTLDEFMGQERLLGPGKSLRVQIENDNLGSMLFWGPPGFGKTTLARVIARLTSSEFVSFSAVLSRTKVYVLDPLTTPQIVELLRRALNDKEHGFGNDSIEVSDDILFRIASYANADARAAYT